MSHTRNKHAALPFPAPNEDFFIIILGKPHDESGQNLPVIKEY